MKTNDAAAAFTVCVAFFEGQAVLAVRGEVDLISAPDLGAIVHAAIDRGYLAVVLDLAELDFMDASGLGVIAGGADRLSVLGGQLLVRSPSVMVHHLLDISGLTNVVVMEQAPSDGRRLGPEESRDGSGLSSLSGTPRLGHLRSVTAIPADDDVVDGALRLVVALAKATVGGADGVSVSLRRHGRLTTVAASDQTVSDMDADQYATGEGPCVDASVEGRWFHIESLDSETRWPAFTPRAQELGINAILSSPLMARDRPVGALNIYSRTIAAFTPQDQELASVFATEASIILTDAGLDVSEAELTAHLQEALLTRQVIAQAQGVVMERAGIAPDAAYTVLRRFSQRSSQPLRERAEQVVASALRPSVGPEPTRGDHR